MEDNSSQIYKNNHLIKYEDINPEEFVIKEEPDDDYDLISFIKIEPNDIFNKDYSDSHFTYESEIRQTNHKTCDNTDNTLKQPENKGDSTINEIQERIDACNKTEDPQGCDAQSQNSSINNTEDLKQKIGQIIKFFFDTRESNDTKQILDELIPQGKESSREDNPTTRMFSDATKQIQFVSDKNGYKVDDMMRTKALDPPDKRSAVSDYRCHSCNSNYFLFGEWLEHVVAHMKSGMSKEKLLKESRILVNDCMAFNRGNYKCKLCSESYFRDESRVKMLEHVIQTHLKLEVVCPVCGGNELITDMLTQLFVRHGHAQVVEFEIEKIPVESKLKARKKEKLLDDLRKISEKKHLEDLRKRAEALLPPSVRFVQGDYLCYSCNKRFHYLDRWLDHMVKFLQSDGCFPKEMIAENRFLANNHISCRGGKYICNLCSGDEISYRKKNLAVNHIVSMHFKVCLNCPVCPFQTPHEYYLAKHMSIHHNADKRQKIFKCHYCNFESIHKGGVKKHVLAIHTKENRIKCDKCDYSTYTNGNMVTHRMNHHTPDDQRVVHHCSLCSFKTFHKRCLRGHYNNKHVNDTILFCHYCTYSNTNKKNLSYHILKHHMVRRIERNYKCSPCELSFIRQAHYDHHVSSQHSAKKESYQCKHCDETFPAKYLMYIHTNKQHLNRHWYQCNDCSIKCISKNNLWDHIHLKHRYTFDCYYCSNSFYSKVHLSRHICSVHNIGDKFKCPHCKYISKSKGLLNQHINVKHNPNPIIYYCFHCNHENKIKFKLAQHMKSKHRDLLIKKKKRKTIVH